MTPDIDVIERNHETFVSRVIETNVVWALRADDGYAVSPSNDYDDSEVIPFWSDAARAEALATDEWKSYKAVELSLSEFIETWLVGMQQEDLLVGTNWDAELAGTELEPVELAYELTGILLEQGKTLELQHFKDLNDLHEQLRQVIEQE